MGGLKAWFGFLLCAGLGAQVPEEFNLPSMAPRPAAEEGGTWRVHLGAMLLAAPKAPGSEEGRVIPLPVFSAEYRDTLVLGSSRIGVGLGGAVHVVKTAHFTWDLGLGVGERRRENRADELAGMGDRDPSLFAGTAFRLRSGGFGTTLSWAEGLKSGVGSRGTLSFGYGAYLGGRWFGSLAISGTWSDADYMVWEFGVSPEQAAARSALIASGDPRLHPGEDRAYAPTSGWRDAALTGLLTYIQDRHWRWFGLARVETYGAQVKASPLVRKDTEGMLGAGFAYAF